MHGMQPKEGKGETCARVNATKRREAGNSKENSCFPTRKKRYRVSDAIYRCVGKKSVEKEHIPFFLWGKEGERSEDNFSCEKA